MVVAINGKFYATGPGTTSPQKSCVVSDFQLELNKGVFGQIGQILVCSISWNTILFKRYEH